MEVFPKRKELASLKQLFVLHGKISIFLHALPLNAGACSSWWWGKLGFARFLVDLLCLRVLGCFFVHAYSNEQSDVAQECPASLFGREAEVLFGALKQKAV